MPEEERKKRGEIRKGATHTQETKDKIGAAHKGKIQPADAVAKARAYNIANPTRPMLGKTHTPAARKKISKAMTKVEDVELFTLYKRQVAYWSKPIREEYRKQGYKFGTKIGTYQLDHIISQSQGFNEGIPPYIIGSKYNCQVLTSTANKKKNASLQKQELVEKIIDEYFKNIK